MHRHRFNADQIPAFSFYADLDLDPDSNLKIGQVNM
jgi:hypothetical protein